MIIAIPKEVEISEYRVAAIPDIVEKMVKGGFDVRVESGAGTRAFFADADYEAKGAKIVKDAASLFANTNMILRMMLVLPKGQKS